MADLDSSEVRQRVSDIREWIFEAVDKIGAPMQYISKESGVDDVPVFPIQDNQIPLPVDLQVLDGVAYSNGPDGPWVPMKKSTSIFKNPNHHHRFPAHRAAVFSGEPGLPPNAVDYPLSPEGQPMMQKMMTTQSQFYGINTIKYIDRLFGHTRVKGTPEYFIKPGWLVTNKSKGFIKLAYKAIATDERGYPLIPDLTSYQEAVYWYVVMKLTFPKWLKGELGGSSKYAQKYASNTYFYCQQQWNFYRNQAYAEAMMPTADDMQNIKHEWNRLLPEFESSDTFFKDINKNDQIYNDWYYGY